MRKLCLFMAMVLCVPLFLSAADVLGTFTVKVVSEVDLTDPDGSNPLDEFSEGIGYSVPGTKIDGVTYKGYEKLTVDANSRVKECFSVTCEYTQDLFTLEPILRDKYNAVLAEGKVPAENFNVFRIRLYRKTAAGSWETVEKIFRVPACWLIDKIRSGEPIVANAIFTEDMTGSVDFVIVRVDDLEISKLREASAKTRIIKDAIFLDVTTEISYTADQVKNWIYLSVPYSAKMSVYDADGNIVHRAGIGQGVTNGYWLRVYNGKRRSEYSKEDEAAFTGELKTLKMFDEYQDGNDNPTVSDGQGFILGIGDDVKTPVRVVWEKTNKTEFTIITGEHTHELEYHQSKVIGTDGKIDESYSGWHLIGSGTFMVLKHANGGFAYQVPVGGGYRSVIYQETPNNDLLLQKDLYPFTSFYVQTSGNIAFSNVAYDYSSSNPAFLKASEKEAEKQIFDFCLCSEKYDTVQAHVTLDPQGSTRYEIGKDLLCRLADGGKAPQFYTIDINDHPLAYANLPLETGAVKLGYVAGEAGSYSIALDARYASRLQSVLLSDILTGRTCELTTSSYDFSTEKGTFDDRFVVTVTLAPEIPSANEYLSSADRLTVWSNGGQTVVDGLEVDSTVFVFDATGRCVYSVVAAQESLQLPSLNAGVYLIKCGTKFAKVALYR